MKNIIIVFIILIISACSRAFENDRGPVLKIGLVADPQYENLDNVGTRNYQESPAKLMAACDTFNLYDVNFVQTLGDVINGKWESFDSILPAYDRLKESIESYHLLGNHEYAIDPQYMPQLLTRLKMPSFYYSHSLKNWRFIVLDGTDYMDASLPLHPGHAELLEEYKLEVRNKNNYEWNGAIGPDQQKWLTGQLDSTVMMNQNAVIFCHMPVRSETIPFGNLLNDYEIDSIISKYPCVKAYISGHYHAGGYVPAGGIRHITIKAMVEGSVNSFAILEIYDDYIKINGFGNQPDIY